MPQHYSFWYITNEIDKFIRQRVQEVIETIQRLVRGINRERFLCLFVGASHDQHELGVQNKDLSAFHGRQRCWVIEQYRAC